MLLYNIVLGNQQLTPEPWKHIIDPHGNHFIAKDDIRQRIRIDNRVDVNTHPELGDLVPVWSTANMQCYNILPGTRWANNNRNMNPLMLVNKDTSGEHEQIVVYITVASNYAITRFDTPYRILQTYHKDNTYQGCAVVFDKKGISEKTMNILSIKAYDKKNDGYVQFDVHFVENDTSKILVNRKIVTNPKVLDSMKDTVRKFKNRYMGFKILTKPNDLLTVTYITSEKFHDDVVNATKNINNPNIIVLDQERLDNNEDLSETIESLQNLLEQGRIRAVTQCGVNLPLEVVRKLKLLYVFNYDTKNNVLSCRKSN